jgi:hypothetical protein
MELREKYIKLIALVENACVLKSEIKRLINHPINKFPDLIMFDLHFQWEVKGIQKHLLSDVFSFIDDFKNTRNKKLRDLTLQIEVLAKDIVLYDSTQ